MKELCTIGVATCKIWMDEGVECHFRHKCYFHHPELNQYPSIPCNFIPHKEISTIPLETISRGRSPRRHITGANNLDDVPSWRRRALDQSSPKKPAHRLRAPFQHHSSRTRCQRRSDNDKSRGRDRTSHSPCRQQRHRRSSARYRRTASSSSDSRQQNHRRRYASARSPSHPRPQHSVNRQHASRGATSHRESSFLLGRKRTPPSHRSADFTVELVPVKSPAKQLPAGFPANQLSNYPLKHSQASASASQRIGSDLPRAGVPSSTLVTPEGTKEGSNGLMQK